MNWNLRVGPGRKIRLTRNPLVYGPWWHDATIPYCFLQGCIAVTHWPCERNLWHFWCKRIGDAELTWVVKAWCDVVCGYNSDCVHRSALVRRGADYCRQRRTAGDPPAVAVPVPTGPRRTQLAVQRLVSLGLFRNSALSYGCSAPDHRVKEGKSRRKGRGLLLEGEGIREREGEGGKRGDRAEG